jgi:thiamine biosynthesis lipoprotein
LLLTSACEPRPEPVYKQQLFAFGTLIDISTHGANTAQARSAVQAVDTLYQKQHRDWHAWQRGALDDLNRAISAGESWQTDPSIVQLIHQGQTFERLSGGLFNPAIGELLALWGFQQDIPPEGKTPSPQHIRNWMSHKPSSLQLDINDTTVNSRNPHVRLDFGGFAKGHSVGKAVELLEHRGIQNLIVNAGGDLCLRGSRGGEPWRIGIRHPRGDGTLATLSLQGAHCVFTSGDYERYLTADGRRYHHILDPRSGYPAIGTRSVTVIANDPALADAAATAVFVAGAERWQAVAVSMGVSDVLRIDDQDVAWITPGLAEHLDFEPEWKSIKIVPLKH